MISQCDASQAGRGRGATSFANGNLVFDVQAERLHRLLLCLQNLGVGGEDEMIPHVAADFLIATLRSDGESLGSLGAYSQVEAQRQRGGIERRTEVGGGGG